MPLYHRAQALLFSYLDRIYQGTVRERYRGQLACMEPDPQALLLDVGCHDGTNTMHLARAVGTLRVCGLECRPSALRQAARSGIRCLVADANVTLPLESETVDVITAMDVLEHLVDPARLVHEVYRVLRPGGYCVVATPNLSSWHNIFALALGFQPFSGPNLTTMLDADMVIVRRMHREAYGMSDKAEIVASSEVDLHRHIVVVAYRSLLRLMGRAGFTIERARGFGYYPLPSALGRVMARIDPSHSHHIVVKGRKPADQALSQMNRS